MINILVIVSVSLAIEWCFKQAMKLKREEEKKLVLDLREQDKKKKVL